LVHRPPHRQRAPQQQLQDPAERTFYESFALDDTLSVKRLTAAIQDGHYETARKRRSLH
jgi:hypothetical protein